MREFLKRHPSYKCVAVDCRGHGESASLTKALGLEVHDVNHTAGDISKLIQHLQINPTIIFGHSFGGKVALKYMELQIGNELPVPQHTWILDSIPGKYDDTADNSNNSVSSILQKIHSLPQEFPSREWIIKELQTLGVSPAISLWLGTNVIQKSPTTCTWYFEVNIIKHMFKNYCELDMWPFVEKFSSILSSDLYYTSSKLHFIRAGKNRVWNPEVLDRFDAIQTSSDCPVRLHTMPHVGHWLHSEDLHGMMDLVDRESGL
jgi:esterase